MQDIVINEVAWMGTAASTSDEWIELHNTTDQAVDLAGWTLRSTTDISPNFTFNITSCNNLLIAPHGYFLLERTDDATVNDIAADCIYTGNLSNSGESLSLEDSSHNVIDTANGDGGPWPAGDNTTKSSMERIDPLAPDSDTNWATNNGVDRNGLDANNNPINGTPRARNSVSAPPPAMGQGDINHDGQIDMIDARLCLQIALGFTAANAGQQIACDVTGDGQVTRADAQKIAQFAIGQIGSLAALDTGALALILPALLLTLIGLIRIKRSSTPKWPSKFPFAAVNPTGGLTTGTIVKLSLAQKGIGSSTVKIAASKLVLGNANNVTIAASNVSLGSETIDIPSPLFDVGQ